MKPTGALLCAASFLLLAIDYLKEEKRKLRAYSALADALVMMKTELCAKLLPMLELTKRAEETSEGCVKLFFQNVLNDFDRIGEKELSEVWNEAARESFGFFSQEQFRVICLPGTVLGKRAVETQAEALENSALYFRSEAEVKKEKMAGEKKLALGLSACAGLLTVIVLY